jgi:hypothetical protein
MDSADKLPWYRLHVLTWLLTGVVAWGFICCQRTVNGGYLNSVATVSFYGWPRIYLHLIKSNERLLHASNLFNETRALPPRTPLPRAKPPNYKWMSYGIVINVLCGFTLVVATAVVVEWWLRRTKRLQLSLGSLLLIIGVFSILFAFASYDSTLRFKMASFISWSDFRHPSRWPVLFGVGCALSFLGSLAERTARQAHCLVAWTLR